LNAVEEDHQKRVGRLSEGERSWWSLVKGRSDDGRGFEAPFGFHAKRVEFLEISRRPCRGYQNLPCEAQSPDQEATIPPSLQMARIQQQILPMHS